MTTARFIPLAAALTLAACAQERGEPKQSDAPAPTVASNTPAPSPEAAPPPAAPATPAAASPALVVEGEGLRLFDPATSRARPIPFGTARADVERALAFRGAPESGTQRECGSGPLAFAAWPDGLKLYFQSGKFTGWALDERAAGPSGPRISTAAGAGPGATRATLTDASVATFEETSLGTEFRSGAISGIVDGPAATAKITAMWAGTSCVFR